MCLNPVKIPNNRKFVRGAVDAPYVFVPCGHCEECKQQKINDWFVRLNYEFLRCKREGGATYFLTCTFANDMVPRISDKDFEELFELFDVEHDHFEGMVFDKAALSQFLQDLRDIIREKYGVTGLKFFCVSEFGADPDKTHRPHYHILIFSPALLSPAVVRSLANYCWSRRVKYDDVPEVIRQQAELPAVKCQIERGNYNVLMRWIIAPPVSPRHKKPLFKIRYGFTSWSRDFGAIVKTSGCLAYCLKYLFKDVDFMQTATAVNLSKLIESFPSLEELECLFPPCDPLGNPDHNFREQLAKGKDFYTTNPEFIRIHKLMQKVRDCMPFHLQSQKLGDDLFQEIISDWEHGKQLLEKNEITFKNTSDAFTYRVPRYIIRRLFYDVGKEKQQNMHYVKYRNFVYLNDLGKECLCEFLDYRITIFQRQINMYLSPQYVAMMSSESVCGFYDKYKISLNQALSKLRNLSSDDVKILFYFKYIFKGISALYLDKKLLDINKEYVINLGHDLFFCKVHTQDCRYDTDSAYYMDMLNAYHIPEPFSHLPVDVRNVEGVVSYDSLSVFDELSSMLDWFDGIRLGVKTYKCISKEEKEYRRKLLRSLYNKFINQINY